MMRQAERRLLPHLLVVAREADHRRQEFEQALHLMCHFSTPPPDGGAARFRLRHLQAVGVSDKRPILLEDEIRAVVPVVTDDGTAGALA